MDQMDQQQRKNEAAQEAVERRPDADLPAAEEALPKPVAKGPSKMPQDIDDDDYALAAARERVAMGIDDYVPEDVPPAADPLPEGSSEAADLAQRGLVEDNDRTQE